MDTHFKNSVLCEFTTEELKAEIAARQQAEHWKYQSQLNIKGITATDFKITIFPDFYGEEINYSFYILKDGEEHDIYYSEAIGSDWWPAEGEDDVFAFIPRFLSESSENCYESQFDQEKTIELLKNCGFKNFEIENYE